MMMETKEEQYIEGLKIVLFSSLAANVVLSIATATLLVVVFAT